MSILRWLWAPSHYWPLFLLDVALVFGLREFIALGTKRPQDTLSDFAWKQLGLPVHGGPILYTFAWYASFVVYIDMVVFLAIHIWFVKLR